MSLTRGTHVEVARRHADRIGHGELVVSGLGDGPDSSSVRVRADDGSTAPVSSATTFTVINLAVWVLAPKR